VDYLLIKMHISLYVGTFLLKTLDNPRFNHYKGKMPRSSVQPFSIIVCVQYV
jgi:hypothetical protein